MKATELDGLNKLNVLDDITELLKEIEGKVEPEIIEKIKEKIVKIIRTRYICKEKIIYVYPDGSREEGDTIITERLDDTYKVRPLSCSGAASYCVAKMEAKGQCLTDKERTQAIKEWRHAISGTPL